jgi:hypothetical protein
MVMAIYDHVNYAVAAKLGFAPEVKLRERKHSVRWWKSVGVLRTLCVLMVIQDHHEEC